MTGQSALREHSISDLGYSAALQRGDCTGMEFCDRIYMGDRRFDFARTWCVGGVYRQDISGDERQTSLSYR